MKKKFVVWDLKVVFFSYGLVYCSYTWLWYLGLLNLCDSEQCKTLCGKTGALAPLPVISQWCQCASSTSRAFNNLVRSLRHSQSRSYRHCLAFLSAPYKMISSPRLPLVRHHLDLTQQQVACLLTCESVYRTSDSGEKQSLPLVNCFIDPSTHFRITQPRLCCPIHVYSLY